MKRFKIKYHPEDSLKRKEEQLNFLKVISISFDRTRFQQLICAFAIHTIPQKRASVFAEVLNGGLVTSVNVDTMQSDKLLRVLDTVVIKLEGGTEEDLQILDEKPQEYRAESIKDTIVESKATIAVTAPVTATPTTIANDAASGDADKANEDQGGVDGEKVVAEVDTTAENAGNKFDSGAEDATANEKPPKKRKRTTSGSSSSSSSSSGDSDDDDDDDEAGKKDESHETDDARENNGRSSSASVGEPASEDVKVADAEDVTMAAEKTDKDNDDEGEATDANGEAAKEADANSDDNEGEIKGDEVTETIDLDKECDSKDGDEKSGPRALHKTSSIFLRNLAPTITKAEVEQLCKRYNGFLRVAIADPLVERRWFRRGWVTFKRDINIKEICWNLNNIRLRDCELGAIVNRDLSRRVRPVNGVTSHKTIVRSDIKLCAKIAHNLDVKVGLWQDDESAGKAANGRSAQSTITFGLDSRNPVLQNITDYLIEEASAEEDELLGLANNDNKDSDGELLERDPQLIGVLDKLILYLRIVHSVDFYNHCEYPYEDEMPNRCGIIHARGPAPQNKVTTNEILDYIRNFEGKMASFLANNVVLEEVDLKKIGCKDIDAEVEKFVQANTQELAKDKWLCPLSGKKFKGPEFIRKHIFNKHGEKVDEVKKEVEYFNNYLKDPKRPQLPEHPGNTKKAAPDNQHPQGYVAFCIIPSQSTCPKHPFHWHES